MKWSQTHWRGSIDERVSPGEIVYVMTPNGLTRGRVDFAVRAGLWCILEGQTKSERIPWSQAARRAEDLGGGPLAPELFAASTRPLDDLDVVVGRALVDDVDELEARRLSIQREIIDLEREEVQILERIVDLRMRAAQLGAQQQECA
jgi:hypothetical protein